MEKENNLWPEDEALFNQMKTSYQSENEKYFFETLKEKMEYENAPWEEVLISAFDNEDGLTFMRLTYDEFIISKGLSQDDWLKKEVHTMSLSEALSTNLKAILNKDINLLQWLQANDYKYVCYDHSKDLDK